MLELLNLDEWAEIYSPKFLNGSELIHLYQPLTEEMCHWELNENILRDGQTKVTHISITHARNVSKAGVHKSQVTILCGGT